MDGTSIIVTGHSLGERQRIAPLHDDLRTTLASNVNCMNFGEPLEIETRGRDRNTRQGSKHMKGRANKSLCHFALAALLLGACSKAPESPVAKTNPKPTQRYEITVELVDPPADIKHISGEAHFSIPHVACMPTPDRIAGPAAAQSL